MGSALYGNLLHSAFWPSSHDRPVPWSEFLAFYWIKLSKLRNGTIILDFSWAKICSFCLLCITWPISNITIYINLVFKTISLRFYMAVMKFAIERVISTALISKTKSIKMTYCISLRIRHKVHVLCFRFTEAVCQIFGRPCFMISTKFSERKTEFGVWLKSDRKKVVYSTISLANTCYL